MDETRSGSSESEPGERPPPGRRLAAPPSARYGPPGAPAPNPRVRRPSAGRAIVVAALISLLGAAAIVLLAGLLAQTAGLLAAIALTGIAIGRTMRGGGEGLGPSTTLLIALLLVLGAVVTGNLGTWLVAVAEGGVLGPIDYLLETFGPLVAVEALTGGVATFVALR